MSQSLIPENSVGRRGGVKKGLEANPQGAEEALGMTEGTAVGQRLLHSGIVRPCWPHPTLGSAVLGHPCGLGEIGMGVELGRCPSVLCTEFRERTRESPSKSPPARDLHRSPSSLSLPPAAFRPLIINSPRTFLVWTPAGLRGGKAGRPLPVLQVQPPPSHTLGGYCQMSHTACR